MQRNSLRQEKEANTPINNAPNWQEAEMSVFQQDKSQRAPPPYPQVLFQSVTVEIRICVANNF